MTILESQSRELQSEQTMMALAAAAAKRSMRKQPPVHAPVHQLPARPKLPRSRRLLLLDERARSHSGSGDDALCDQPYGSMRDVAAASKLGDRQRASTVSRGVEC